MLNMCRKCNNDPAYKWRECIMDYLRKSIPGLGGCILPYEQLAFAPHLDNLTLCSEEKSYRGP